jgi:chondroitin AC lyase
MLDYGAIGREIARPTGGEEAVSLISISNKLAMLRPDKKPEFDLVAQHIDGTGSPFAFIGHKHFWNSDFTAHERKGYYTSVKMNSARTNGTESINGENLKGFWIPFGVNYVARRGDEYAGIFPVWDWSHLPGVTSPETVPPLGSSISQPNQFVGGVSDGTYGASGMQLDLEDGRTSLHAHKAWFFFDDEEVALGAGITSAGAAPVNTTLNQSLLNGDVMADNAPVAQGRRAYNGISWVLHDGIGYVFPNKSNVVVKSGPETGSWSSINIVQSKEPVTKNVFSLWLSHGVRPSNASYEYIVVPDTDAARLSTYAHSVPVRVLANTATVQAVAHEQLGISEMIFYSAGRVSLRRGLDVSVDQPCMLILQESNGAAKLTISSPQGPMRLHVSFIKPTGPQTETFTLPGDELSGASQTKSVVLR